MVSVNTLRSEFLNFFKTNGHELVSSAPLVPHNDPTLMFVNAGMVPFKDVFTGNETRDYSRATSSQKCVRAGGKHNDLDNVGYTARHHTFFEMLGNFSFGDYFKDQAIEYAWNFVTKTLELPSEKLLVTVYHTDDEAYQFWKKIAGLPDEKIVRIEGADNFWAMGNTGPCGPCSEIFYDHGEDIPGGPPGSADEDGDRFIEIWNLVFMQYETLEDGTRIDLPKPSIDTGMGLERVAAVLQGVHDNYDIDLFQALISKSKELSGNDDPKMHNAHRVIADHLRSSSFLLADGVMPSNEGRGYVLRRIMRRSMRYVKQLGCEEPLMHRLVPTLVGQMGEAFPELVRAQELIAQMLKLEETQFGQTLGRGLKLLDKETENVSQGGCLSGDTAFKLYDTYGFPYDLTVDILRGRGISVDQAGFDTAMQQQKDRAKAAWKGSGAQATDGLWYELKEEHGGTEFVGYNSHTAQGSVVAIIKDGEHVNHATVNDGCVQIVLNQTPFYGQSGGQEGDHGVLVGTDTQIQVVDTLKMLGCVHSHVATVTNGSIKIGDVVTATIDQKRRFGLRANHSATHLLHAVLREQLGDHVTQKGSLVDEDRLRFDFSHPQAVTADELEAIERKVNELIRQNSGVSTKLMAPDDAIKEGAMALFGEKYGDEVRVLTMGEDKYSVELCGGTHVQPTGDIGLFKIVSESAIASGVRRIEAVTAEQAITMMQKQQDQLLSVCGVLKTSPDELHVRIESLLNERKQLEKDLAKAKKQAAMGGSGAGGVTKEQINGIDFLGNVFDDIAPKDLRAIAMDMQAQIGSGVVAVASTFEGKGSVIVLVTEDMTGKISAVDIIKQVAPIVGAKGGGGKPNFAQTGGPDGDKVPDVMSTVKGVLEAV